MSLRPKASRRPTASLHTLCCCAVVVVVSAGPYHCLKRVTAAVWKLSAVAVLDMPTSMYVCGVHCLVASMGAQPVSKHMEGAMRSLTTHRRFSCCMVYRSLCDNSSVVQTLGLAVPTCLFNMLMQQVLASLVLRTTKTVDAE